VTALTARLHAQVNVKHNKTGGSKTFVTLSREQDWIQGVSYHIVTMQEFGNFPPEKKQYSHPPVFAN